MGKIIKLKDCLFSGDTKHEIETINGNEYIKFNNEDYILNNITRNLITIHEKQVMTNIAEHCEE